jgi:hypothetical protein
MEALIATQCGGFRQPFRSLAANALDALLQVVILLRRRHSSLSISDTSGQVCLFTSKRLPVACVLIARGTRNRVSRIWCEG